MKSRSVKVGDVVEVHVEEIKGFITEFAYGWQTRA